MEIGAIQKFRYGFLFAFYMYSNYMAVSVAVCEIASKSGVTLKTGLRFVERHWKWHHLIDRIGVPIRLP